MREFIGHQTEFVIQGYPKPVTGVVVEATKDLVLLKGGDGKVHRIPKGKICSFTPIDSEPVDYVPFHMLHCWNKAMKCPGVKFIQEGAGVARADFDKFMRDCPCRVDECDFGTHGELRTVKGDILRGTLGNTIYGDYPEKKEEESGDTGTDDKA